jgi:CheY-like chemotaxis protein
MTANAFTSDREASFNVGMIDHVAKPIIPGLLCEKLLTWLESSD